MTQQHSFTLADRGLAEALSAVDTVQVAIRRADTKAAALVGFQLSVVTVALSSAETLSRVWAVPGLRAGALLVAALLVGGLSLSFGLLGSVLWPRLDSGEHLNRFAFPSLAALSEPPEARTGTARDDAWRLAIHLSCTATRKYQLIRAAMGAMAASTVGIVGWLCLATVAQ